MRVSQPQISEEQLNKLRTSLLYLQERHGVVDDRPTQQVAADGLASEEHPMWLDSNHLPDVPLADDALNVGYDYPDFPIMGTKSLDDPTDIYFGKVTTPSAQSLTPRPLKQPAGGLAVPFRVIDPFIRNKVSLSPYLSTLYVLMVCAIYRS